MMSDPGAKYEALRLLLAGAATRAPANLESVLEAVCRASGLAGAAIVIEPFDGEPLARAGESWAREALSTYLSELWGQLTRTHGVESAYLQLNPGGRPQSLFAYPVYEGDAIVAAVMGLAEGRRNLALEEDFLVALATAIRLTRVIRPGAVPAGAAAASEDALQQVRLAAILETAIAVNHEVNNPLTAVLGNTQLLLMQADRLDPQLAKRLRDIEASALRIKDVTQRLLKQDGLKTTEYPGGLRMLDLSDTGGARKPGKSKEPKEPEAPDEDG
jgi:signal transduction histidine kinase